MSLFLKKVTAFVKGFFIRTKLRATRLIPLQIMHYTTDYDISKEAKRTN